ncbi:MAG: ribosome recycling factor [Porphyromonas sp.]|nr:ribosome recycling factor [Porphyromonas sp.]
MNAKDFTESTQAKMRKTVEYLDEKLAHIRAGKANPKILDDVLVNCYGSMMPINQVATVTVPDAKTIAITPWDKKNIRDIEKAIMDSPIGITPENNGETIRLCLPPLTEERRKQLVKQVKGEVEEAKISIRNFRREAIEAAKKSVKNDGTPEDVAKEVEADMQKIHDKFIEEIDKVFAAKEKEILTV